METSTPVRVYVRWVIRRDMPEIMATEEQRFPFCWVEEDFLAHLRQRNCIGMVAEVGDKVVGYMVYIMEKAKLRLLNFAVDPNYRRRGIGSQLMAKLQSKLQSHRRTRIVLTVRETELGAQHFLRAQGFEATKVLRGYFQDSGEDGYRMVCRLPTTTQGV